MKIYHTETQADYDALLIHLKELGYKYIYGSEFSEERPYVIVWWTDMVMRSYQDLMEDEEFKSLPITKYKAKVNEMKFTKENVEAVINEYFRQAEFESCGDLIAEIHNLDDTPEKVVVPKFVAEFYEDIRHDILAEKFRVFETTPREDISMWYMNFKGRHNNNRANAQEFIAKMDLYGYEVEKEPMYHVATKDGGLMLFKYENVVSVTPVPIIMTIKDYGHKPYYQLTEKEIKNYDERYWPFAVKVSDELIHEECGTIENT